MSCLPENPYTTDLSDDGSSSPLFCIPSPADSPSSSNQRCGGHYDRLALHHGRRPHQAQAALPFSSGVTDY